MSRRWVAMTMLAAVGAAGGGGFAWWITESPASLAAEQSDRGADRPGVTEVAAITRSLEERPVIADQQAGDDLVDRHGHQRSAHELDAVVAEEAPATPGRQGDVWVDELPLGPLPDSTPPDADSSQDAVAGYLTAAHTVTADDADIRHRRHHPWLHESAPGRTGGHWTDEPPADGVTRTVEIVELDLHAAAEAGAAWRVTYRLWDGDELHAERTRYVATRQEADGRWLVVAETTELEPVAH